MPENMVNGFNINGTPVPYNYDSLGNKLEKTSIAREYSNIDTYNVDEYVIYNGKMYRCKQKILVGESFDSTKWTECSVGPELNYIKKFMTWSDGAKNALLNLLTHVAYTDEHGQDYYDELEAALFQTARVVSLSAVFEQGSTTIYDTANLNSLKQYLTVTATYEDMTVREITGYMLSGTLTVGTSTITVSYAGKTTTFSVTVTHGFLYETSDGLFTEQPYVHALSIGGTFTVTHTNQGTRWYAPKQNTTPYDFYTFPQFVPTSRAYLKVEIKVVDMGYFGATNTTAPGIFAMSITDGEQGSMVGIARPGSLSATPKLRTMIGSTVTANPDVSTNEWHTIEAFYENGKQTVLLDGNAVLTNANPSTPGENYGQDSEFRIGASTNGVVDFYIRKVEMSVD